MQQKPVLLVCGASARQVVSLATQAGFACVAVDLFADWDTRQLCRCEKVEHLDQLGDAVKAIEFDQFIFTGGLENHFDLVRELCVNLPCRDLDSLVACRDPLELSRIVNDSELLRKLSVRFPETTRDFPESPTPESWLIKQTGRAGGLGVHRANSDAVQAGRKDVFFQREIHGDLASGLFIGNGNQATLLGTSSQWSGKSKLGCREFIYCGSIAPYALDHEQRRALIATANVMTAEFGLRGVFGIDVIFTDKTTWVIEINPRITASAEVCQPLLEANIVEQHLRAICDAPFILATPHTGAIQNDSPRYFGKAVIYNRLAQPQKISQMAHRQLRHWHDHETSPSHVTSQVCDIPMLNTVVSSAAPVVTVTTSARDKFEVERTLFRLAEEVYRITEQ